MKIDTRDMILASLFTALTVVGAKISINLPFVPASLQLLFCCFAGILLGAKLGMLSQFIYMIIGLMGLPVFSKPVAGPQYILQPTFGYVLGFVVAAFAVGLIKEHFKNIFVAVFTGIILDYIVGVSYMFLIVNIYMGKAMTVQSALKAGVMPFIAKDIIGGIIVSLVAAAVLPALKNSGLLKSKY